MNLRFVITILALASSCFAQSTTPAGSEKNQPKSGQTTQSPAANTTGSSASTEKKTNPPSQPATPASNTGQATPAAGTAPQSTEPSKPGHRTPPAAKSQEEFNAFQQIAGMSDLVAAEKATDEFATKFPQSDLRPLLYGNLMRHFQQANDSDKTLEMARKVLQYLPDDTMALVMSSTVLAERTRDTDLDRDERYAEAKKNAQKAVDTVDSGLMVPANITPEQFEGAKHALLSMAHSALGMVDLSQKNDAAAEQHFKESIQLNGGQTDPLIYMRLALAQDHQKKYTEALVSARTAVQSAPANSPLQGLAQQEVDRLVKLTGAAPVSGNASGNSGSNNQSTTGTNPGNSNVPKSNPK